MENQFTKNTPYKNQVLSALRHLIIKKVINYGESITKVAQDLKIKRTTVNTIVHKFCMNGRIEFSLTRGHPTPKLLPNICDFIKRFIEINSGITLKIKE